MAKQSLKDRMAKAKKLYAKTEAMQGSEPLPPGTGYTGIIGEPVIAVSKNDNLGVTFPLTVTGPAEFEGRHHHKWCNLETENGIGFFTGDLEKIDVEVPDDIADIGDALDEAEGVEIRFDVVQNDEFTNTYFRERVGEGSEEDGEEGEDEDNDSAPEYSKRQLTKLGKDADKDDEDAIDALSRAAEDAGLDPDEYDTWAELAGAVIEELGL